MFHISIIKYVIIFQLVNHVNKQMISGEKLNENTIFDLDIKGIYAQN